MKSNASIWDRPMMKWALFSSWSQTPPSHTPGSRKLLDFPQEITWRCRCTHMTVWAMEGELNEGKYLLMSDLSAFGMWYNFGLTSFCLTRRYFTVRRWLVSVSGHWWKTGGQTEILRQTRNYLFNVTEVFFFCANSTRSILIRLYALP